MSPLVVHPHFHPRRTGVTRHVEAVVRALSGAFEARVLGGALEPDLPRISLRELWARLGREGAVWHAHRNNELLAGLLLRLVRPRLRVVFTRHAARPGRYTRLLARGADALVTLNPEMATQLGAPSRVVGHGVELARFTPPEDRARAFGALGLGGRFGIGVVGRVRPAKGQGDLVEALAPLLPAHPEWRAVLVGAVQPPERAWADGLVARTGGALVLAGEQPTPERYYRGLTVVVQPSHSEGYSMALLEAMACGACVVAARLPYAEDAVEHGRTGFLYPPGDVAALRALLAELLEDPARAVLVGAEAAEEARRRLGVDAEARTLAALYRPLVERP